MKKYIKNINKLKDSPSKIIENTLLKISILGMLSLVLVQFFISNDSIRTIVSGNSHEVITMEESTLYKPSGWVEIKIRNLSEYKKLSIYKNGTTIEDALIIDDTINIEVEDGDVLEVDTTHYKENIEIIISDISNNIENLEVGEQYKSNQNIVYLFKVKIDLDNNS